MMRCVSVFSQILQLFPRIEFQRAVNEECLPRERSWLWWTRTVCHKHGGPALPDPVDVETDPERFVVWAEGEDAARGHGGSITARQKIAPNV